MGKIFKYQNIYVPVDNSELSNSAVKLAVLIAKNSGAKLYGSHVYAAKLHEKRFKTMEGGLPERYQEEEKLEDQRKVHDSLISQGLEIITDSYLEVIGKTCKKNGIPFSGVTLEGRNWQELVKDINSNNYDLILLGGHGTGRVPKSVIGSVVERILRRVQRDILICKKDESANQSDTIVTCLDGSSHSWGALYRSIQLARSFKKKVVALSVFDPYFHYAIFTKLKGVLSGRAKKVFKFEKQEKLHEDIIDSGLAKIYQSHLEIAEKISAAEGIELTAKLMDGKAFEKILDFIEKSSPWLVVVGRIGVHSDGDMDIGSNSENICRLANFNVLVVETQYNPPLEFLSDTTITWSKEATKRMDKIPAFAEGIARRAVQNYCISQGNTVVTSSVLNEAIKQILPAKAIEKMGIPNDESHETITDSEMLTLSFRCEACGHIHNGIQPVSCPICGKDGQIFKLIESKEVLDGVTFQSLGERQITWERSCFDALNNIENKVLQNQIKIKLEKQALKSRLTAITMEMFNKCFNKAMAGQNRKNFKWTSDALKRLKEVPAGFMRNTAKKNVEKYAKQHSFDKITLELVESELGKAKQKMAEGFMENSDRKDLNIRFDDAHISKKNKSAKNKSYECNLCGFIIDAKIPDQCPSCEEETFRKITQKERKSAPDSATVLLQWDEGAMERIEQVPDGFVRFLTRCRIEQFTRKCGYEKVTRNIIDLKYKSWENSGKGLQSKLKWSVEAEKRLMKIPEFVRPMVMREVERNARSFGKHQVDNKILDKVLEFWENLKSFHMRDN
jgi:nucleotide-binding universal stress UspA family protein/rubrerythrin